MTVYSKRIALIKSVSTILFLLPACNKRVSHFPFIDRFSSHETVGYSENPMLREASGLIASVKNPGHFWTHNDSGDEPRLFLIDKTGEIQLIVHLKGAENKDWEDIAICRGETPIIYVGDIGDNKAVREQLTIYAIDEPTLEDLRETTISAEPEKMTIQYKDGAGDAETLLYDDDHHELIIISKRDSCGHIYAFTFEHGEEKEIAPFGFIPIQQLTAGDVSGQGRVLLKNYNEAFLLDNADDLSVKDLLVSGEPKRLRYEPEKQGEAIAWNREGDGFYVLSEWNDNEPQPLVFYH